MAIMTWMVSLPRLYLYRLFRTLGGNVRPNIPNRFDEGYGLNPEALDALKAEGVQPGNYRRLRHPLPG